MARSSAAVAQAPTKIHTVDTVPPPPGEDDAYGAETRVGPALCPAAVKEMMARAGDVETIAKSEAMTLPPPSGVQARVTPPLPPPAMVASFDEPEVDGWAPTTLAPIASMPPPPMPMPVSFTSMPAASPPAIAVQSHAPPSVQMSVQRSLPTWVYFAVTFVGVLTIGIGVMAALFVR